MGKINVKKSILEIVEKNNLEILKIDLCNDYEFAARFYGGGRDAVSSRVYTTLDDFHFYEYLMVHPNRDTYFLFIDNWSQEVVRIYINDLLSGDYYVGKYDLIFVMEKRKDFFRRMIKNCDERIEELKSK